LTAIRVPVTIYTRHREGCLCYVAQAFLTVLKK